MEDFLRTPVWYRKLGRYSLKTLFLELNADELAALANGDESGPAALAAVEKLKPLMSATPGNAFVSVDCCAPTDTERFAGKRGAVYSAASAWTFLARSRKVREAAAAGGVSAVCVRPFRRMSLPREFRLFIQDRRLKAASQYNLIRHFRRLEGVKEKYWKLLSAFSSEIAGSLEIPDVAMDVYVTSSREVLITDLNPFGEPTRPLLLRRWDIDWDNIADPKLKLMPPPVKISGEVTVSF